MLLFVLLLDGFVCNWYIIKIVNKDNVLCDFMVLVCGEIDFELLVVGV